MSSSTATENLQLATTAPERNRPGTGIETRLSLPGLDIQVVSERPVIILSGKVIAVAARVPTRRSLIQRLFSIPELESLRLNWRKGEARLEFGEDLTTVPKALAALAKAMRHRSSISIPLLHEEVALRSTGSPVIEIRRDGLRLTLWRTEAFSNRVYHFSHPLLRSEPVRRDAIDELSRLTDVVQKSFYFPLLGSDSLLVIVRPHRMEPAHFQEILDAVFTHHLSAAKSLPAPNVREMVVNANLAIAPIADFVFPPLGLANIALTLFLSRKYVPGSLESLRKGKFTLELLYVVVAIFTITTYEFFPAALMYWFMSFWPRRAKHLYDTHQSRFIARYRHRPSRVWLERNGVSVETRIEGVKPSNIITLSEGDIVPGDGTIVEGTAEVNERLLTGASGNVSKARGSTVYSTSRVVKGSAKIRIDALGSQTAASRLALWYRGALLRQHDEPKKSIHFAENTVLPVLLTAGIALLPGGLPMTKAVLRPDYLTGPLISEDLIGLATVIRAANKGILITEKAALGRLIRPDCVVFDDSVSWPQPETTGDVFGLLAKKKGLGDVVFFANRSAKETELLASHLGFHLCHEGNTAAKRNYIALRQRQGHSVIYVGNCETEQEAAAQADLAISVLEPPYLKPNTAPIALLSADLMKVLDLHDIAADSAGEFKTAFRLSLTPNIAAVLSALLLPPSVYVSVLLTNLGSLANYVRSGTILHLSEADKAAKQAG